MADERITIRRCNFTMIGNVAITDPDLDLRTLGLYVKMYQKASIPGFTLYKNEIQKESKLGRDAFQKCWNLLISNGYLIKNCKCGKNGRFYYEYELLDEPETPSAKPEADPEEQPAAVSHEKKVAPVQQNEKSPVHGFPVSGENTLSPCPEKPCPGKPYTGEPYYGKSGHNNNTILNNTILNNTILSSSSTKYKYTKADEEELKAVPEAVQKDTAYSSTAILSTIEDSLEYKPNKKDLKRILKESSGRFNRKLISSDGIQKPFAYYLEILANVSKPKSGDELKAEIQPNKAHNFHQRDYDYDQLEKSILAAQW